MSLSFEHIDHQFTPIGQISLRRRRYPATGDLDVYEVKLGEEFLMSSLFVEAEEQLADLGLAAVHGDALSVVVGGLGLGYTAVAALNCSRVQEMLVVETLQPVIDWHRQGKVPLGATLNADDRCRFVQGSFFDLALDPAQGFDPAQPGRLFDAILLDIDHSPTALLNPSNAGFYTPEGLAALTRQLRPGGVFALWSNDPPDAHFMGLLGDLFLNVRSHVVAFDNPFRQTQSTNTVYVARLGI
ncbi:MAG: spermidine synthase [Natronospirillum sp.]